MGFRASKEKKIIIMLLFIQALGSLSIDDSKTQREILNDIPLDNSDGVTKEKCSALSKNSLDCTRGNISNNIYSIDDKEKEQLDISFGSLHDHTERSKRGRIGGDLGTTGLFDSDAFLQIEVDSRNKKPYAFDDNTDRSEKERDEVRGYIRGHHDSNKNNEPLSDDSNDGEWKIDPNLTLETTMSPTKMPNLKPVMTPSIKPTIISTIAPTTTPTATPTATLTNKPYHHQFTTLSTNHTTQIEMNFTNLEEKSISYHPGKLIYNNEIDLFLSEGLNGRIIAKAQKRVQYDTGDKSPIPFHNRPDAGACFPSNDGGWYYLSNSEGGIDNRGGGVGRIYFDSTGAVKEYKMLIKNTKQNCGSGSTPWGTFISCEERNKGQCWEIHPEEHWEPRPTKMGGKDGGRFESVAFDSRDMLNIKGFVTTDLNDGALHRFSPNEIALERAHREGDYSDVLHIDGKLDYLQFMPEINKFQWTKSKKLGQQSAATFFPNAEGIDIHNGFLYFVSKTNKELFTLNLDTFDYSSSSTESGTFNGQPDQIIRLLPDNESNEEGLLYFLEEGGNNPAGIYARDSNNQYYTVIEGGNSSTRETTGLSFCDNGKRMIFAFQEEGILYEVMRDDNEPFYGKTLNVKYHSSKD